MHGAAPGPIAAPRRGSPGTGWHEPRLAEPVWAAPLAAAGEKIGRLDQALAGHPLLPGFLYRARLDAVRRQAAADGLAVDPWHLAALLEGLRLRMDPFLSIAERGAIFEAARHAFALHQWLAAPDFDQEGAVRAASRSLAAASDKKTPLLAAAHWLEGFLRSNGAGAIAGAAEVRPAARAALVRFWVDQKLLAAPVPLTAPAALRPPDGAAAPPWGMSAAPDAWIAALLTALADEAALLHELLRGMERAWWRARHLVAEGRRKHSRAALAVDILAAAPLVSPRSLGQALDMAVGNAGKLLDAFCDAGIAVEVSHRSARRLFGLAGLAPLRDATAPPRRPEPGRGRGRPPLVAAEVEAALPPLPPPYPVLRRALDYSDLSHWMAQADAAMRQTRRVLAELTAAPGRPPPAPGDGVGEGEVAAGSINQPG
jgi:hypothetical protein